VFLHQVEHEQARLRAFIRSLGVRAEAVDDLAQDALLVAYEKRDSFDPAIQQDFGAWVRGIARKLAANAMRKEARRRIFLSEHLSTLLLAAAPDRLHPLAGAAGDERLAALSACLTTLPEHSRRLIHLRYFEELSPGAMAGQLERSANDVRQVLFRIRNLLLTCIEKRLAGMEG
jgi:RNA polymerase sigma-70 factor (ECF subfamily)